MHNTERFYQELYEDETITYVSDITSILIDLDTPNWSLFTLQRDTLDDMTKYLNLGQHVVRDILSYTFEHGMPSSMTTFPTRYKYTSTEFVLGLDHKVI